MRIFIDGHTFHYEMENLVRLFYPNEKITVTEGSETEPEKPYILTKMTKSDDKYILSASVHFDDFEKVNKEIKAKIENVQELINKTNVVSNELINKCRYNLNDSEMNNQCKSFKTNYVNMISSYENMIDQYNKVITSYNNYAARKGRVSVAMLSKEIGESKKLVDLIK